jgi:CRISPR-associated protein Csy2
MTMRRFLLIPHVKIHNANAMSSPYTIGFPAMTAWLGAVHALERHLHQDEVFQKICLKRLAVSCHQFDLQTYKGWGDYVSSIIGSANPLDKDGNRPAFIEEARCHLTVSLLIEYEQLDPNLENQWISKVNNILPTMKMASGDILDFKTPEILRLDEDSNDGIVQLQAITRKLMLGHVLIERRDLMMQSMQNGKDALDALLEHLKIMHRSEQDAETGHVKWTASRLNKGWIVPIAVGFQGISTLGKASNQRDSDTMHRFAESIVTLGEFIMPYRIEDIDSILWQYEYQAEQDLYVCTTHFFESI